MGKTQSQFQKSLLATSVASCVWALAAGSALAQEQSPAGVAEEEVIVTGIKRAQADAVSIKRDAAQVVDGISAEDIGKLPDVTITDSLQRISGVQIRRSAGEGGKINIRGLDKVSTQMNGESFLTAKSLTTSSAELGDLPSQLFKGTEIYKSATAKNAGGGLTGTINLITWRPMDFGEGITSAVSLEGQSGVDTGETDPVVSGLFNWRNDTMGFMVSASYANVNLGNDYNGLNSGAPDGDAGWANHPTGYAWSCPDLSCPLSNSYVVPQGLVGWNQQTERERYGINGSFQADLGNGFEVVVDVFAANQDEYNRKQGINVTSKWSGDYTWIDYLDPTDRDASSAGYEWITSDMMEISPRRIQSFAQNDIYFTESQNYNFELNYDNGGSFTGKARFVYADAQKEKLHGYVQGDTMDGNSTGIWNSDTGTGTFYPSEYCDGATAVGDEGGCYLPPNPNGWRGVYDADTDTYNNPIIGYNTSGDHPVYSGFDQQISGGLTGTNTIEDYLANLGSYNVAASVSENNQMSTADMKILRLDGAYQFHDGALISSIDFGARYSQRSVEEYRYHLFSNFYAGSTDENGDVMTDGCAAQWKATDVAFGESNDCSVGEFVDGAFVGYTSLRPTALDAYNDVNFITDFGDVSGLPGVWVVDPHDLDDPEAYQETLYGNATKQMIPGTSYDVELTETSLFAQANFEHQALHGNFGLRAVETELSIRQNITGDALENGNTNLDAGDVFTNRTYYDLLPSFNFSIDLTDDIILRGAWAKNMMPLDLNQWGDGLSISYNVIDSGDNAGGFRANSGTANGNPELKPWRSTNKEIGLEWYAGEASMASVSLFKVKVDSFVQNGTIQMTVADGTVAGFSDIDVTAPVQGEDGTLSGMEIGGKLALSDFISDGIVSGFGVDANYTYSPSKQDSLDVYGNRLEFPDNSKHQVNLIGWYEANGFQARIAYNYRSERLDAVNQVSGYLPLYQKPISYVDLSVSYDIQDDITVYLNGSNITNSYEEYYLQWEDQYAFQRQYEARYTLGIRAKF